jgi:L-seryl-tRNA(Ser) seleniumtransferase
MLLSFGVSWIVIDDTILALTAAGLSESELAARLRTGTPAVLGRVQDGKLLLDLRAVFDREEDELLAAVGAAAAR